MYRRDAKVGIVGEHLGEEIEALSGEIREEGTKLVFRLRFEGDGGSWIGDLQVHVSRAVVGFVGGAEDLTEL